MKAERNGKREGSSSLNGVELKKQRSVIEEEDDDNEDEEKHEMQVRVLFRVDKWMVHRLRGMDIHGITQPRPFEPPFAT